MKIISISTATLSTAMALLSALVFSGCGGSAQLSQSVATPSPEPSVQAFQRDCDVDIPLSDGTVLKANITRPDIPGTVPTILTMTVYNKDVIPATDGSCDPGSNPLTGNSAHLAEAGYAVITVDVRGTGSSGGEWDIFGEQSRLDNAEVLDWIQAQPWSNGRVGATGCSALGVGALHTAIADSQRRAQGKPKAVYAVWADAGFPDWYRDVFGNGGNGQSGAALAPFALMGAGSVLGPVINASDPNSLLSLAEGVLPLGAVNTVIDGQLGGELAYNGPWFRERSAVDFAEQLAMPVAVTANLQDFDAVLRGSATLYHQLKKSKHRMLLSHPGGHCQTELEQVPKLGFGNRDQLVRAWFNRWLKDSKNGIDALPGINIFPNNGEQWIQGDSWPLEHSALQPYYLSGAVSGSALSLNDGSLYDSHEAASGSDTVLFQPLAGLCSASTASILGFLSGIFPELNLGPCATDNRLNELTQLTYTTAPVDEEIQLAGPITADLWASFAGNDGTLVATLSSVSPDGASQGIAIGWLRASSRALDEEQTRYDGAGQVIQPFHPFTEEATKPVDPGTVERYLVELVPSAATLPAGHRLRLTIATADTPAILPSIEQILTNAPTMTIHWGSEYPSAVLVPITHR